MSEYLSFTIFVRDTHGQSDTIVLQKGDEYAALNPMGQVPALHIDGVLLTQSVSTRCNQ